VLTALKVHNRLLTLLDLIRGFSVDYYRQTSLLLGEHSQDGVPGIDFPLPQLDHAVQSLASIPGFLQPGQEPAPAVEEKKERKKRSHDPNAPKRPLTPYFLYMQTARPIIASDLGAEAPKGAVQEEGQRRWKAMGVQEKSVSLAAASLAEKLDTNLLFRAGTTPTSTTSASTRPGFTRTSRVATLTPSS
jgi:hypothetical protein